MAKRKCLLVGAALVAAVAVVYAQLGHYDYVTFDDPSYVFQNPHVRAGITWKGTVWAFTAAHSANWHPTTWLSHMLDCELFGAKPGPHHLSSVALHALNAVLLFVLLRRITGSCWRSAFVAGLFALHPLNVESVAWISERKNVLSTLFWILTMLAYARYAEKPGVGRYLLVVILFALGLMAKPMLVSLPFVLLLTDYWPLSRGRKTSSPVHFLRLRHAQAAEGSTGGVLSSFVEKLPLFALSAASCVITLHVQGSGGMTRSLEQFPPAERAANALVAYVSYLHKMVWPRGLCMLYPHPGDTLPAWQVLGSGLFLAAVTFAAVRLARRYPYLLVGWLWYVVTLIPVIGLVQVGPQAMADRYAYVPLIGVFVALSWGIGDVLTGLRITDKSSLGRAAVGVSACIVLLALAVGAWRQAGYWKNAETCFDRAIRVTRSHPIVWYCMSGAYQDMGDIDTALAILRRAITRTTDRKGVYNRLGFVLAQQGRYEEAVAEYKQAIRLDPGFAIAHNNLGAALARLGRIREAARHFALAIRLQPGYVEALHNLGVVLNDLGRTDEAVSRWREALKHDPNRAPTHLRLGVALMQQRKLDEALKHLERAVELSPDWGEAHYRLAIALFGKGDYAGAWSQVRMARKNGRKPDPLFIQALSAKMPEHDRP